MGLEVATTIAGLVATNPSGADGKAQGDDHIRLLKAVLKASFPNLGGALNRNIAVNSPRTFLSTDNFSRIIATGVLTLTLPAVASLGDPWSVDVVAKTGNVTIAVTGADTINGAATFFIPKGTFTTIVSTGDMFFASQSIFSGAIVMKEGLIADIPPGWSLCDGTNGTPDLRNRFIIGAGSSYAMAATGGTKDATVVAHSHSMSSAGDHNHTFPVLVAQWGAATSSPTGGAYAQVGTVTTSNAGTHTHTVNSAGSSGTDANLPPYYALFFLRKD